jgi:RHS repeat-associated protein
MKRRACLQAILRRCVAAVALPLHAAAAPGPHGANTGDGSTSFTGLAQAPEASMFVGAATLALPIELPPGRAGMTPRLALTYNSSLKQTPFGAGWDLPIGRIQRCLKRGVLSCHDPVYRNEFVLELPTGTVECTLDAGGRCLPAVEESFLRIEYEAAINRWVVFDRDGKRYTFGNTADARTGSDVGALFVAAVPAAGGAAYAPCRFTFSWALTRIEDTSGNTVDIDYSKHKDVLYPLSIRYGGNAAAGLPSMFEVSLTWEDYTGRGPMNATAGFPAEIGKRLQLIDVRYAGALVRRYDLSYSPLFTSDRESQVLQDVMLSSGEGPLLNGLQQPARTTFLYQRDVAEPLETGFGPAQHAPAFLSEQPSRLRIENKTASVNGVVRDVFDMNGDGFADLVDMHGCTDPWSVYLGGSAGFATTPVRWSVPDCAFIRLTFVDGGRGDVAAQAFDIDGDAIPDYVDALHACSGFDCDYSYWRVYRGRVGSGDAGWGFESTPIHWPKPAELDDIYLRTSAALLGNAVAGWPDPVISRRDLIDMNADGLADLVSTSGGEWKIWFNTGSGFAAAPVDFAAPYPFLRLTSSSSDEMIGLYDINGDALPDQVVACDRALHQDCPRGAFGGPLWEVYLNTGYGLRQVAELWTFGLTTSNAGIRRVQNQRVVRDLFDINGDSLPDVVEPRADNNWNVYLNSGFDFRLEPVLWMAASNRIRDANSDGLTEKDTFDFDGDGLVDFVDFDAGANDLPTAVVVRRNSMGAWCASADGATCTNSAGAAGVARSLNAGTANLLVQLENGIGGTTHLEYRPSTEWDNTDEAGIPRLPLPLWTLAAIDSDDGLCDAYGNDCVGVAGAAHSVRTEFRYGRGLYDHVGREFRGFGTVERRDADGNLTTTRFHQDRARRGKAEVIERFAADAIGAYDKPIDHAVHFWRCADAETGGDADCAATHGPRLWLRQVGDQVVTYSNFGVDGAQWRATTRFDWARCAGAHTGNAAFSGALSSDGATVVTRTDYACAPQRNQLDKPIHTYTHGEDGNILEEAWFLYDDDGGGGALPYGNIDRGLLTRTERWIDATSPLIQSQPCTAASAKECTRTRTRYDGFGNAIEMVDANDHATQITYDAPSHFLYPSITTNAAGHKVAAEYDIACGKLLSQTLPYRGETAAAARVRRRYDSFCRLERTANADEDLDASPHEVFLYRLGAVRQPTVMKAFAVEPYYSQTYPPGSAESAMLPSAHYLPVVTMTDSLGRPIQRLKRSVVDGQLTGVAAVTMSYDARGRVARQYVPFVVANTDQFTAPPAGAGFEQFSYDALGRLTAQTNPDGGVRRWDHKIAWQTTAEDECYADPSCPGGRSVEQRDAAGRVVERQLHAQTAGGESLAAKTRYTYDPLGRLIRSVQWNDGSWSAATEIGHTYDSLGRRVALDDPDSGRWTYGYDAAGNLRWQDDPKPGQHVQFCYDAIDRVTKRYVFTNADFPQALTTCAFGATVEYEYDSATDPYGIGQLSVVEDPSGSTWFTHDARGRLTDVSKAVAILHEPPMQNAPPRWAQFVYTYDVADHIASIRYPDGEIVAHRYDAAGRLNRLESDDGRVYLSDLTYDVFGRRRRIVHGDGTIDERAYSPGQAQGYRLSSISTTRNGARYIDLAYSGYTRTGLITRIDDRAYPSAADLLSSTVSYEYDGIGRLVRAAGNNLPTPPNDRYAYDLLGNIILKEGKTLTYDAVRPHQLTRVNGDATGIAHDANGSRIGKAGQAYGYGAEGRVESIGAGAVSIQYDYSGRQVAKYVAASAQRWRFFNELAESRNDTLIKYYFAGDLRIASRENTAWQFAAADRPERATRLAAAAPPSTAGPGLAAPAAGLVVLGITLIPGRRRRGVGLAVGPGHVLLAIVVWCVGAWPPAARRALGGGGGGTCVACSADPVVHYHVDHLGSTLMVSRAGSIVEHVRYRPFGAVRLRLSGSGGSVSPAAHPYEFTGYQTDATSGLQYAGARFYDPDLGLFLSHDPQRQFPSPYAYGSWNPVNGVDPDGEFFFLIPVLTVVLEAVSAILSAVQAALSALITELQPVIVAAAKGAAKGAAGGLVTGSIEAVVTDDAGAILDGVKQGAIGGAITGAVIDGTALGSALDGVAGQTQLGLNDLAAPSTNLLARGADGALRGAVAGAVRGAVGNAATTIAEGGDFADSVVEGLGEGAIRGAFGNVLQPAVDEVALAAVGPATGRVADFVGVAPNDPGDASLASLLRGGLLRSAAGAALADAHKGAGEFLGRGFGRLGRFDPVDLGRGAASGAKGSAKTIVGDYIKRIVDHHVVSVAESPQVHR